MRLSKIREQFFSEERDIQERLFILNIFVTTVTLLATIAEIVIMGGSLVNVLVVTGMMTLFLFVSGGSILTNHIRVGSVLNAVMVIFVFVPGVFFFNGGINGCAPIWFLYNFMFISMILSGWVRGFFLFCNMAVVTTCYTISILHPEFVRQSDPLDAHMDSIIALLLIGIAMSLMVMYESSLYVHAQRREKEQRQEIENLNAAQNQFFSSMSHEIRTPINTIIGLNEMILREDISDEVAEDAVNIQSASKMLLHLINDILDMSKFQSGQMQLMPVTYRPGDMLSELVGMLWIRAKEKKLAFHVSVAPDLPAELVGDEVRIKQILINVVNNAIKYTKDGSVSLSIQCGQREGTRIHVLYSVSDTGIGIKKENIPYLFTAFRRVDEEKNRHIEGTGLGLSIVKQFVDLMEGEITVNSVYTEGTTFIIDLPQEVVSDQCIGDLDLESHHSPRHTDYHKHFEAPDARILVVDDNAANLMVVQKLLRDTNVQIDTASSGAEALRKTLDQEYHVIFMDHLMPEMDGLECRRRILSQTGGRCKDSKIVALTANAGAENRVLYQKEGFDGYLVKPVSGDMLEQELYRLLPNDLVIVTGNAAEILEETISWMQNNQRKKSVVISTESVADLPQELIDHYQIAILPHMVCTNEGDFRDGIEIDTQGLLSYMQDPAHSVVTRPPDVQIHESFFAKQLSRANNVIHVSVSSKVMHSGCPKAMEAATAFDNVRVVDTGHLSGGQGMMALEACRLAEDGRTADEIIEHLEMMCNKVHTSFIVDDLDFLSRAGQVSRRIANLTRSFMVRPILVLRGGKMHVGDVCMGSRENAWHRYIMRSLRRRSALDTRILLIPYVGLTAHDMEWIREEIESQVHFDKIYFQKASPAIAVNCGPGAFGLIVRDK